MDGGLTAAGPAPAHRPDWPAAALADAVRELAARPPLVDPAGCDRLRERLGAVARGEAFLLQGGDCAETFAGVSAGRIAAQLGTMAQMAAALADAAGKPVVTVGRIAGQYAKPRSNRTELRDGVELPSYRGDAVNGRAFTAEARAADPRRMVLAYESSAATADLIRTFLDGGGAGGSGPAAEEFYTSHEALLLDYEQALTRTDPRTGRRYDLSAHLVWIGMRTRGSDGAHIEFAASVDNPVAVKLDATATPDQALALIDRLDPDRRPGRLSFIVRTGAGRVRDVLPDLVEKVTAAGAAVGWICDPMHGNTFETEAGLKTRDVDRVLDEIRGFFEVHRALGTQPGGVHLELTGDDVTECVGGPGRLRPADLARRYETACDPRLNREQALDLADRVAELLHGA